MEADDRRCTILIVGSMWYGPNQQGVDWFLDECWPAISAALPGVRLRIVGLASAERRRGWERHPRTEAPGFIQDLRAEYASALVAVAPVHYGGGSCLKFLEAAAFGVPCVTTSHVFAGYRENFRNGDSTLVAANATEMIRHCLDVARDPGLRATIARNALGTVRRTYTVDAFNPAVAQAVQPLLWTGATTNTAGTRRS
jgi:glycosyltransferase involved in cell wall biosynthesis